MFNIIIATIDSVIDTDVYVMYMYIHLCMLIYNWDKWQQWYKGWKKLGLFCNSKEFTLPVKCYNVIWKWSWISYKHILQTLGQPLRKV